MGFSCLLVPDHFNDRFAALPATLCAASATTTLHVGTILADNDYRHPMILAKEVATIDVLSEGCFELGLSLGFRRCDPPRRPPCPPSAQRLPGWLPRQPVARTNGAAFGRSSACPSGFRSERSGLSHNSHLPYSSAGSGGDRCLARTIIAIEPEMTLHPATISSALGLSVQAATRSVGTE